MPRTRTESVRTIALVALAASLGLGPFAVAEDFRVENKVFAAGRTEPISRSTTVFSGGTVYDFMHDPEEMVVFDPLHGKFVLLDARRRMQTELATTEVAKFTQRLKQWADAHSDPFIKFSAEPKFESRLDGSTGKLMFSSTWMTYRIDTAEAGSPEIARQYREFSDWLTRLNALLSPSSRLPFARLAVNEILAERGVIAREVELTVTPKKDAAVKPTVLRSQHQLGQRLAASDLSQVKQAREAMDTFKQVAFDTYRKGQGR
jgi:hypothetical protein